MAKKFLTPIQSTVATGTAPFSIASTTAVTNLNADLLDGQHGSYYAPLASPALTGIPTAPTASAATNTTQIATTAYVKSQGYTTNTGTVTSVGVSVPTGLSISGSPVTTSGTIAISLVSGYEIPTTAALAAKAPLESPSFTGTVTVPRLTSSGDLLPATDNTGVVGSASNTWNNGQFTNLTIDSTLNVRTAIDLADSNVVRFGSSDDTQMFYNGSTNIMNIELETSAVSLNITDNGTNRVVITKSTGTISAGTPTASDHLTTKAYVDSIAGGVGFDGFFLSGM